MGKLVKKKKKKGEEVRAACFAFLIVFVPDTLNSLAERETHGA